MKRECCAADTNKKICEIEEEDDLNELCTP